MCAFVTNSIFCIYLLILSMTNQTFGLAESEQDNDSYGVTITNMQQQQQQQQQANMKLHKPITRGVDATQYNRIEVRPIGKLRSPFSKRSGTPRQPLLVKSARAILTLDKSLGSEILSGLDSFSHVWIIYLFHENTNFHTLTSNTMSSSNNTSRQNDHFNHKINAKVRVPRYVYTVHKRSDADVYINDIMIVTSISQDIFNLFL